MTPEQLPLLKLEPLLVPKQPVEPLVLHLLMAWKVFRAANGIYRIHARCAVEKFLTLEAAQQEAERLDPAWTHKAIYHVELEAD